MFIKKAIRTGFLLLLTLMSQLVVAQNDPLEELFQIIPQTQTYDSAKIARIDSLKNLLKEVDRNNPARLHQINQKLFSEYESFKYDSAYVYIKKNLELARRLNNSGLIHTAEINFGQICVSAGMYKEALDTLLNIRSGSLKKDNRSLYYGLLGRCYGEMENISNIPEFSRKYDALATVYRDSALTATEPGTYFNSFLKGFIKFQKGEKEQAYNDLIAVVETQNPGLRDYAVIQYVLGNIAKETGKAEKAINHWSRAAIADIKSSTKETLAIIKLAKLLFNQGATKKAAILIRKANEDAVFFGARQRKIEIVEILPYIEQQVIQRIEQQKQRLVVLGIVVSTLLIFVVILAIIIYRQMINLKEAKAEVTEANQNLQEANRKKEEQNVQLQKTNQMLLEANKIKEEYIGNFFIKDSSIVERFENYVSKINQNLKLGNIKEINHFVKTFDPEKEKSELLANFDKIFIQLFPDFVEQFNSLFQEKDKIQLKEGELLNMELRIFALIRLGIKHNEKIAQILGYSVNTIYTYKTKIRNKSIVDNDAFDKKLIEATEIKF